MMNRKIFALVIISFLWSLSVIAQNWQPISGNEVYNYRFSGDNEIYTIKSDSMETSGSISTFYMNRVVLPCDTCTGDFQGAFLKNQAQFLMREMIKSENGVYTFTDPEEFHIHTLADLNDTWDFMPSEGITAEVVEISTQEVLGVDDNIKVIELSNGKILTISENHGIVSFPDFYFGEQYNLIGMETAQLGYKIPDFWDFYDFQIGDVFQYTGSYSGPNESDYGDWKLTVLSKQLVDDELIYEFRNVGRTLSDGTFVDETERSYEYNPSSIENSYQNQLVVNEQPGGANYPYYSVTELLYDENDEVYRKQVLGTPNYGLLYEAYHENEGAHPDLLIESWDTYDAKFAPGLGAELFSFNAYEHESIESLIGFVKDGDTTGTVYSDAYLLPVSKNSKVNGNIKAWPNPSSGFVNVEIHQNTNGGTIQIVNSEGILISEQEMTNPTIKLNTSNWSPGLYLIQFTDHYQNQQIIRFVVL